MRRPAKNVPCAWHDGRRLFAGGNMADNLNDSRHFGLSAPIVVTLPDGARREFAGPVTGAEIAAAIGPGLAKAAIAITDRRQAARPRDRDRPRCRGRDHHPRHARGARDPAPRRRACHGRGGQGALSRDPGHLRPGDRDRLLLRFRARRAVHARRPRKDRGADARDRPARREDHPRSLGPRRRRSRFSPASASATRPSTSARSRRTRRSASIARAILSICASARICRRPAISARPSS